MLSPKPFFFSCVFCSAAEGRRAAQHKKTHWSVKKPILTACNLKEIGYWQPIFLNLEDSTAPLLPALSCSYRTPRQSSQILSFPFPARKIDLNKTKTNKRGMPNNSGGEESSQSKRQRVSRAWSVSFRKICIFRTSDSFAKPPRPLPTAAIYVVGKR